jgi:L-asparagine transporter-like permease
MDLILVKVSNFEEFNFWFSVVMTITVYVIPLLFALAFIANSNFSVKT